MSRRAAVDAVLRAASKGSRLTIVEIGHGEFARALRSLTIRQLGAGGEELNAVITGHQIVQHTIIPSYEMGRAKGLGLRGPLYGGRGAALVRYTIR